MDFDALIAKYLNGETTSDEFDKLNHWRQSSLENELIFRRSEDAWHLAHTDHLPAGADKAKTWNAIHQNITGRYSLSTLVRTVSVAASIALVLGLALSYIFVGSEKKMLEQPQQVSLFVSGGVCSKTILPDSTVVWLNSYSTISYPSVFEGDSRTIELVGEAFFDVTRDETKPFIINSGNMRVKVLGTSFNFKHYAEDTHAVLAVETGVVTLSAGQTEVTTLSSGKYAKVDNQTLHTKVYDTPPNIQAKAASKPANHTPRMIARDVPVNQFSSWRTHRIVFRDEPFGNVLNELSRRYNAEFEIQGEEIVDYIYTATFDDMSLEDVLRLLKLSAPIDYTIKSLTSNEMNAYGKRKVTIFRK